MNIYRNYISLEEWDSYLQKMEYYGLSEYLEIKQKYFDAYIESLSEEN